MAPPLFGAEFIRRRQKRRKKARLSKIPSQPARDKGCGTQCLDTHNAACGIETLKAILFCDERHTCLDTHNAACGIETLILVSDVFQFLCGLDTHNAACGIDSKTALRVLSVTQSRFRMQKAHSNLDDAAHRC